ncbi:MAG: hypothetical protein BJ554DRAFT_3677 [Olpidium bornovanus]|uniref:Uncharacterized protein n=1 Tax=Olpidium bornovanus TaxID=278681 RepID=A0A8H7ZNY7_9FUNG|nr:MAG: hypothetical protein BJ554DRAFT_3677 [Olpidium bornovanus]
MFFLTPLMASSLLVASECLEGFQNIHRSKFFATGAAAVQTVLYSAAGGGLASIMILSEFCLISRTSVVTLSVGGIVKVRAVIWLPSCSQHGL